MGHRQYGNRSAIRGQRELGADRGCGGDMITVAAIICPKCEHGVFSRARHDFRWCPCGGSAIDGGFDYMKVNWPQDQKPPEVIHVEINSTREQLYDDWNRSLNNFGRLTPEQMRQGQMRKRREQI